MNESLGVIRLGVIISTRWIFLEYNNNLFLYKVFIKLKRATFIIFLIFSYILYKHFFLEQKNVIRAYKCKTVQSNRMETQFIYIRYRNISKNKKQKAIHVNKTINR